MVLVKSAVMMPHHALSHPPSNTELATALSPRLKVILGKDATILNEPEVATYVGLRGAGVVSYLNGPDGFRCGRMALDKAGIHRAV